MIEDTFENDRTILRCLLEKDPHGLCFADLLNLGALHGLIQALTPLEENPDWDEGRAAEHAVLLNDLKIVWYAEQTRDREKQQQEGKDRRRQQGLKRAATIRANREKKAQAE